MITLGRVHRGAPTQLALPYHAGMRPYGHVVFQWSCHTVDAPGAEPRHTSVE